MKYLYESLYPNFTLQPKKEDWKKHGILKKFAQREFLGENSVFSYDGLDEYGFVYYPQICLDTDKKCKVHVYLHGCTAIIGEDLVRNSDFLEYAAANDMIIIFPQNMYNLLTNPFSCWSTSSSTLPDENYFNQNGI